MTLRANAFFIRMLTVGLWLLAAWVFPVSAATDLDATTVDQRAEIAPTLYYLEDPDSSLPFSEVSASSTPWQRSETATANFGYTTSTYWFRMDLSNPGPVDQHKILVVSAPYLDQVEYFLMQNGHLRERVLTGDQYPFAQRAILHPQFLFPLQLQAGQHYELIFRVKTPGAMEFPASLWNEREFYLQDSAKTQIHSIYYGILLFVIFFNLFIYYRLKENTYLYYVLFTLSILLIQSTLHARTFEYLWPNLPQLQNLMILYCVPLAVIFSTLFAHRFLELDRHSRWMSQLFRSVTWMGVGTLLLSFILPYAYASRIALMVTVPTSLALLIVGPVLWYRGVTVARYYTIAWVVLQIGASATILFKLGVLPGGFFTIYGLQIGSGLEAILLSVAIADRIYRERIQKLEAQQHILEQAQERREVEKRLLEQATHSGVTGLPNRVLFENKVQAQIQSHYDQPFLIVLIYLSRFHEIDKTLGHENADRLLRQVAQVLNLFCSQLDDIFLLEQNDRGKSFHLASLEGVTLGLILKHSGMLKDDPRIQRLMDEARKRIEFDHLTLDLGARIGAAHYPFHSLTASGLIRKAYIALDAAASDQRQVATYRKELDPYNERRLTLMAELDKAIAANALELHYQPQQCLKTGRIVSVETLLRWRHPEYGFVPPDEFVVLAERTGIITALTRWVMNHSLKVLAQLRQGGLPLNMSINISAINLREPEFARQVANLLEAHRVPAEALTLELTETAMMSNPARALEELTQLHQIGVQLSIDDFGTGYSSLSYIRRLPIHEIKIDKSLIFDLSSHVDDQVVVKTTLDMCHNLGYRVVAEGVETENTLNILNKLGCDLIQGYHLARPMPLATLQNWLDDYHKQQPSRAQELQHPGL